MPLVSEEAYKVVGFKQPQPGDQVLVNGVIQIQGEALTDEQKFERQLEQQVQQAEQSMALQAEAQGGGPGGSDEDEPEQVEARLRVTGDRLRVALAKASPEQFGALEAAVVKCRAAGTGNGEWRAVKNQVQAIAAVSRVNLFK